MRDELKQPARWCNGESIRFTVGRPGVHSLSRVIPKDFKKWYLVGAQHIKGICLHLYVADRWPTCASPDYSCEVANPACHKRRLLATHQWHFALLVVGLPITQDWFEMGCHLSPLPNFN